MKIPRNRRSELARTFAVPGLLALASGTGLVIALVGDGVIDVVAGVGIAAPLAAVIIAWLRRSGC